MNIYATTSLLLVIILLSGCTVKGPLSKFAEGQSIQTPSEQEAIVKEQVTTSKDEEIQEETHAPQVTLKTLDEIGIEVATFLRNVDYTKEEPFSTPKLKYLSPGMLAQLDKDKNHQIQIANLKKRKIEVQNLKVIKSSINIEDTTASIRIRGSEKGTELGKDFKRGLQISVSFFRESTEQWVVSDIVFTNF